MVIVPLVDERGETVCKRYLNMQCGDRHCPKNHRDLFVDRQELQGRGAYLEHKDFSYFVGVLFDSRFVWFVIVLLFSRRCMRDFA